MAKGKQEHKVMATPCPIRAGRRFKLTDRVKRESTRLACDAILNQRCKTQIQSPKIPQMFSKNQSIIPINSPNSPNRNTNKDKDKDKDKDKEWRKMFGIEYI